MNTKRKWFKKAVYKRKPNTLGGWHKWQSARTRRRYALASRPRGWSLKTRYLFAARALQALANVTQDPETKRVATADAKYFYRKFRAR
ncbi:MAG: hypothetical protein DRP42_03275 [Tenericutes bacterium]|nr:MAG: hypothetical protein DRP42_03275 [Mycoplasmatota bacterium]